MRVTREVSFEIKVTPWVRVEDLPGWEPSLVSAYRIWIEFDGRRWWQTHEWEKRGGNGERFADAWIHSAYKSWPPNAADPEPGEEIPE